MKGALVVLVLLGSVVYGQEENGSEWRVMPGIVIMKHFSVEHERFMYVEPAIYPPIGGYPVPIQDRYSGAGLAFNARFFNPEIEPFVFTVSAGANWYHQRVPYYSPAITVSGSSGGSVVVNHPMFPGAGFHTSGSFMSFPLGAGIQFIYPYATAERLMFFAGAEGNLHFLSDDFNFRRQVYAGYTVLGGFAIKFVEFGVRYTTFSDVRTIGVQAGVRFNQFGL